MALQIGTLPTKPSDPDNLFTWGSTPGLTDLHILRLPRFADVQLQELVDKMGSYEDGSTEIKYFDDDTATSALFALQLSDPIYSLRIRLTTPEALTALASLAPPDGGAEVHAPRTLKRLKHSRVERSIAAQEHEESEDPPPEPDHDALAASATFERHESYSPAPCVLASLGPHVRAIPTETPTPPVPVPALRTGLEDDPANAPRYNCSIYSYLDSVVQTGDHLPQDLIFSVLVGNNKNSSYRLVEFDVRIRLGGVDPNRHMLMEGYDGPGPSMLSNLRFNVLASFPTVDGVSYLQLRLLPRSSKGWIDITSVHEMSFLLCLAKVNEFKEQQTLVRVETFAYYKDDHFSPRRGDFLVNIINQNASQ